AALIYRYPWTVPGIATRLDPRSPQSNYVLLYRASARLHGAFRRAAGGSSPHVAGKPAAFKRSRASRWICAIGALPATTRPRYIPSLSNGMANGAMRVDRHQLAAAPARQSPPRPRAARRAPCWRASPPCRMLETGCPLAVDGTWARLSSSSRPDPLGIGRY